jgi:hypothetical protein
MHQPGEEHGAEGEGGVVAVAPCAMPQHQSGDENQAEGFHDADDGLVMCRAGQLVEPGVR